MYFDTSYIAKFYFNEPGSPRVRELVRKADGIHSSLWASALMVSAPRDLFIRTADAVHLSTAQEIGERDVWTNDRHMLAAAAYFGLTGRSV